MKKLIFMLAASTFMFASCGGNTETETPTSDSTAVVVDSTTVVADSTKVADTTAATAVTAPTGK